MELITVFLKNLTTTTNEAASKALEAVNKEYLTRVLPFESLDEELVDLYDSARDYSVIWPQPLGEAAYNAVKDREFFSRDDMSGLRK